MNLFQKATAGLLAATTLLSFTSCGGDDNWTYKLDDHTVTSGMYIGLSLTAYQSAQALEGFDATKTPFDQELEGKDGLQWVVDKTESLARNYLAVEQKFDEMELTVDEETQKSVDSMAQMYYEYLDPLYGYADKGFGLESYKKLQLNQHKMERIFNKTYGEGGSEEVSEDELKTFFYDNNRKVFYISVNLTETNDEGEQVSRDQADIDADIEMLTKRLEDGDDFQAILDEYFADSEAKPSAANFNAIISKDDVQTPQNIRDFAFDAEVGDVKALVDSTATFVMKKLDLTESEEDFSNNRASVLSALKADEFNARVDEWGQAIQPEKNESSLKKHSPKHIKIDPIAAPSSSESAEDSSSGEPSEDSSSEPSDESSEGSDETPESSEE